MSQEVIFDHEEIKRILPHRYPFLLFDKIIEYKKEESVVAIKNVTANEEFFQGHFPKKAVMPGVLVMEAMAQASAILARMDDDVDEESIIYFVGVNNFKWRKMVIPGDTLRIEVKFLKRRRGMWVVYAEATVDGNLVACGELSAMVSNVV